nr:peptidyl-prolyl cis-trans isomerase FKBP43-like [Ipomoea batatas]
MLNIFSTQSVTSKKIDKSKISTTKDVNTNMELGRNFVFMESNSLRTGVMMLMALQHERFGFVKFACKTAELRLKAKRTRQEHELCQYEYNTSFEDEEDSIGELRLESMAEEDENSLVLQRAEMKSFDLDIEAITVFSAQSSFNLELQSPLPRIEVKAGKPVSHCFERTRRLRISQATLGIGDSTTKSLVQCNVGNKTPVFLCALLPDKTESCHLDLEFEEEDGVVFSVLGPRSVHLTGYYLSKSSHAYAGSDTESYGEDIANTDTELSNQKGLRKKRQVIVSEDDDTSQESGDEDKYILSASKNRVAPKETSSESGEGSGRLTDELTDRAENGDSGKEEKVDTMDTTNVSNICKDQLVNDKDDHKLEPEYDAESAKRAKPSKKRKYKSEDAKSIEVGISGQENMSVDDKTEQLTKSDMMHEVPIGIVPNADELSENGPKLKKRKKRSEGERLNECKDSSPSDDLKEVKQDAEGTDISKDLPATTGENKLRTNTQSVFPEPDFLF